MKAAVAVASATIESEQLLQAHSITQLFREQNVHWTNA